MSRVRERSPMKNSEDEAGSEQNADNENEMDVIILKANLGVMKLYQQKYE